MADEDWAVAAKSGGTTTTATPAASGDDAWAAALAPAKRNSDATPGGYDPGHQTLPFQQAQQADTNVHGVAHPLQGHGTQIARTLGAVYAPLSPTGPLVGAKLKDVQQNPAEMLAPWWPGEHTRKMLSDAGDTINKDRTPHGVVKAIEDAQEKYGVTSGEGLQEQRRLGGPVGSVSDFALHHPRLTGVATGLAELANPTGLVGDAAKAALGPMARAVRASKVGQGVADAAGAVAAPFDRYAGVRAGAGPEGEHLAHTMESRLHGSENAATEHVVNAFGDPRASSVKAGALDPDKMVQGLTREEQLEVQNRAYQLPQNSPYAAYTPNKSLDASVLKRTGRSIDDRAAGLRDYQTDVDKRLVASGVMPADDLYESGTYAPMKQYRDRPVFSEDFLNKNPEARDGTVPLSAVDSVRNVSPRGGFGVSRAFARGTKTQPPNYLLPEGALDEQYLPAHQILEHYGAAERAIAQADALKLAERTKVPNVANPDLPDQAARLPIQYNRRVIGGQIEDLGEGVEGRNAATNLVNRQRSYDAKMQAANEIAPDLAGRRSPFRSALYLQGIGRGAAARATDLEAANKAIGLPAIGRAGRDVGAVANELDAAGAKSTFNAEALRDAVQQSSALKAGLQSTAARVKDTARGVLADLQRAQSLVKNEFTATGNKDLDAYLYDAAQQRGTRPAYQERFANLEDAAGNTRGTVRTSGNANRARGYEDSQFTPADVTATRKAAAEMGVPLSVKQTDDLLHQAHAFMVQRGSELKDLVAQHGTGEQALQSLSRAVKEHIASLDTAEARASGGASVHDTLNAPARAAAEGADDFGQRAAALSGRLRTSQGDTLKAVERGKDKIAARGDKVRVELDDLADKLLQAKANEKLRLQIEKRASEILRNHVQTVSEQVDKEWGNLPKGYARESELQLGAHDSNAMGIKDELGKLLAEPLSDPRGRNVDSKFQGFMRGMQTLNNLTRTTIISMPTVHVIGNLGANFLAKYKDFAAFGRIMSGKGRPNEAQVKWLRDSGALPGTMGDLQGVYEHGPAETLTRNRSEIGRAQAVDQYVSQKYWAPNQKLVFGWYETHYAWEAAKKEMNATAAGRAELASGEVGPESMKAARNVRKTLGDYRNISGFEKKLGLDRLMYFYPWLKTAVSFWTKQGILDPKSTIVAPERAIQANNEVEGYDDPNQPWTASTGRESDGSMRRTSMPYAGRITEDIGRTLALPVDAVNYFLNGDVDTLKTDLKSPFKMIKNRLNPFGQAIAAGMENASGVQRKGADKPSSPGERIGGAFNAAATEFVGPLGRVEQIPDDPAGALSSLAGGGFSYAQPVGISRSELAKFKAGAAKLRAAGQDDEAAAIEQRLREIQGAP